jgi:low affinity Fe/Cu permease
MEIITEGKQAGFFERLSRWVSKATGSTPAFIGAVTIIVVWLITGPLFGFSEAWQLYINTGTTIITFLMVFVIQRAQNKDSVALQMKLNELVASHENASNRLISVEELSEEELQVLQKFYHQLAIMAKKSQNLHESHSIEEAEVLHSAKFNTHIARRKSIHSKNNDPKGHTISSKE